MSTVKKTIVRIIKSESGQGVLIAVLTLLVIGGLIFPPLLGFMNTGLKTGQMHENKAQQFYAADAGVEDALWQIKNDKLPDIFISYPYDEYDYSTEYQDPGTLHLNNKNVNVSIQNIWIPKDIATPNPVEARGIIEEGKLVIVGTVKGSSQYEIKIIYYYEQDSGEPYYDPGGHDLKINTLGIWLPPGHSYVADSSNLEADPSASYYSVPGVETYASGKAVTWSFSSVPLEDFPNIGSAGYPMVKGVTFNISSPPDRSPEAALSWITTTGVGDVPYAWDADSKVYHITSVASDPITGDQSQVEAYTSKTELRKLSSAISGEYHAIGNSLMVSNHYPDYIRDTLLSESDATASGIPSNANVEAAYLYWSGWLESGSSEQTLFYDDCSDFGNWNHGSDWYVYNSWGYGYRFEAHHHSGRKLTLKNSLDLSPYSGQTVTASWDQWEYGRLESGDCLQYAFSSDGGSSWGDWQNAFCNDIGSWPQRFSTTVPTGYVTGQFKIRFKITGFSGRGEYCDIDNIKITVNTGTIADTTATFKIDGHQVYFDENGDPQEGAHDITAEEYSVLENRPGEYSFACYLDVTDLLQAFADPSGNGSYTVGDVDSDTGNEWSYAAWSLIIIYSSPETKGHQLYLYDDFKYVDNDETLEFPISGFLVPDPVAGETNAAKLTCFVGEGDERYTGDKLEFNGDYLSNAESPWDNVWNSKSPGLSEDGIDIDTFYVTWASGLLEPGDTSAQINMPTGTDSWNLVYLIISFRSDVTTGGTISYLLTG